MDEKEFVAGAQHLITDYLKREDNLSLEHEAVYTVWLSKVLQNNKGLFSTPLRDGRYYEITYNGNTEEYYCDVYQKTSNQAVPADEVNNKNQNDMA